MTACFSIAQILKDNSIIDICWGIGFMIVAWYIHLNHPHQGSFIKLLLVTIWGLRLALYLFKRNKGKAEDWRYAEMRKAWGKKFLLYSFIKVFMLQGAIMFLISLPLLQIGNYGRNSLPIIIVGISIFCFGFIWETIADWQLMNFKSNKLNKGKLMTTGLWSLSRHPNYFGEMVVWWGIFIVSIPNGNVFISLVSPLLICFLLARVSGVPYLERRFKSHPEFSDYLKRTNKLIPDFRLLLK